MLRKYGYVLSSSYRVKTMKALNNETKIPTQISKDSGIRTNHISKVLAELKEQDLVLNTNLPIQNRK